MGSSLHRQNEIGLSPELVIPAFSLTSHSKMSDIISIQNDGPLVVASNFWKTDMAARGFFYVSVNAGAVRLLVPSVQHAIIGDMCPGAKYVVVSCLSPDRWQTGQPCAEWMVEDESDFPWSCQLHPEQIDRVPTPEDVGRKWIATVWEEKNGLPYKCVEWPAYAQIVPRIPWLKRIDR